MDVREVIQALHYEDYCDKYQDAYVEINKK